MNGGGCDWVSECAMQELVWLCPLFWSSWVMPAGLTAGPRAACWPTLGQSQGQGGGPSF